MHGFLILDKPLGITSAHAVAKVKRILKPKKIGHAGTLDPLASGVLPLALGEATKLMPYVMDTRKSYEFTVTWGEERATDDLEGEVTCASSNRPGEAEIRALLPEFTGRVLQAPPAYSAIKIGGERAYKLARSGAEVEIQPREVEIHALSLISFQGEEAATFRLDCGKGTYVRSLARDLGRRLGCFGHVSMLRRTRVGKFDVNNAISLDKLGEFMHTPPPYGALLPMTHVLDDIPAIGVDDPAAARLKQGQAIPLSQAAPVSPASLPLKGTVQVRQGNLLLAIGEVIAGSIQPKRVFDCND